jgi:hypothetical protein
VTLLFIEAVSTVDSRMMRRSIICSPQVKEDFWTGNVYLLVWEVWEMHTKFSLGTWVEKLESKNERVILKYVWKWWCDLAYKRYQSRAVVKEVMILGFHKKMCSLVPCRATSNFFQACATRWVCISCTLYSSNTETKVHVRGVIQSSGVWCQVPLS